MSWCVSGYGVFWHSWLKIALNVLFQLCDVQSGFDRTSRSVSAGGITEGWEFACGKIVEKNCRLFLDKASAIWLEEPGRWTAVMSKLLRAAMKNKQRNRAIASGSLLVPVLMIVTTATLSQWHKNSLAFPCIPPYSSRKNDHWQQLFLWLWYYRKRECFD